MPLRHQLLRIAVLQAVQPEGAPPRNLQRLGQQRRRIDPGQRLTAAQMALAIAEQPAAGLGQRPPMAQRRQRVLQRPAALQVHVHVAAGHRRQPRLLCQRQQMPQHGRIIAVTMQFHRQPGVGEDAPHPGGPFQGVPVFARFGNGRGLVVHTLGPHPIQRICLLLIRRVGLQLVRMRRRQPQAEQPGKIQPVAGEVLAREPVAALAGGAPPGGDQAAQRLVTGLILHQQHETGSVDQPEFAADNEGHPRVPAGLEGAHDAGQRALVGNGQRLVAAGPGALEELRRAGRPPQEGEVRQTVQLGIGRRRRGHAGIGILSGRPGSGAFPHCWLVLADSCLGRCRGFMAACHANHPCSIQGPCWPTAENAQAS